MHLTVKVVGETTIIIETGEVRAADIANLELLVAGRTAGIGQVLELAFPLHLGLGRLPHLEELIVRPAHLAQLAEDLHLLQPAVNSCAQVRDRLQQDVRLPDLVRCFFQPPLCLVDTPVALLDILLQVARIVDIETVLLARRFGQRLVFRLEPLGVDFGART